MLIVEEELSVELSPPQMDKTSTPRKQQVLRHDKNSFRENDERWVNPNLVCPMPGVSN